MPIEFSLKVGSSCAVFKSPAFILELLNAPCVSFFLSRVVSIFKTLLELAPPEKVEIEDHDRTRQM